MSKRFAAAAAFKTFTNAHLSILLCNSNHQNDPEQCTDCNKASRLGSRKIKIRRKKQRQEKEITG